MGSSNSKGGDGGGGKKAKKAKKAGSTATIDAPPSDRSADEAPAVEPPTHDAAVEGAAERDDAAVAAAETEEDAPQTEADAETETTPQAASEAAEALAPANESEQNVDGDTPAAEIVEEATPVEVQVEQEQEQEQEQERDECDENAKGTTGGVGESSESVAGQDGVEGGETETVPDDEEEDAVAEEEPVLTEEEQEKERKRLEAKAIADANREKRKAERAAVEEAEARKKGFAEELAKFLQTEGKLAKETAEEYTAKLIESIKDGLPDREEVRMKHVMKLTDKTLMRAGIMIGNHRKRIVEAITQSPDTSETVQLMGEAQSAFDGGDWTRTVALTTTALKLDETFRPALALRGAAHRAAGDYAKCIKDCSKVIHVEPKQQLALSNRGTAYYKQGQWSKAEKDLTTAIEVNPDDQMALYARAESRQRLTPPNYTGSYEDCTALLKLDAKNVEALVCRGAAAVGESQLTKAVGDCTKALRLSTKCMLAYYHRAEAYRLQNQLDAAIIDASVIIDSLSPEFSPAWATRGAARLQQKKHLDARRDLARALELDPANKFATEQLGLCSGR